MANQVSSRSASEVAAVLGSAALEELPALIERYRDDPRKQVQSALARAERRLDRERAERERVDAMYAEMAELGGPGVVVGVERWGVDRWQGRLRSAPSACRSARASGAQRFEEAHPSA